MSSTPKPRCSKRSSRSSLLAMTTSNIEYQEVQKDVVEVCPDSQHFVEGPSLASTSLGEWNISHGTYTLTHAWPWAIGGQQHLHQSTHRIWDLQAHSGLMPTIQWLGDVISQCSASKSGHSSQCWRVALPFCSQHGLHVMGSPIWRLFYATE